MLTLKEAKKIPYEQIDDETEGYIYDLFRKYVVRKQISDANKELSTAFAKKLKTNNPRDYASCFNRFNNAFVGSNLIGQLDYNELHTRMLKEMSEDKFNWYLQRFGNSFDRKAALVCYSMRPSERLANRMDFSAMIAYANMQRRVMQMINTNPKLSLDYIIDKAALEVRSEHYKITGKKINQTQIAEKRTDYKSVGKQASPLWREMIKKYKGQLKNLNSLEAANFVLENFIFTDADRIRFDSIYDNAISEATMFIDKAQFDAESRAESDSEFYNLADYDEVFTVEFAEEIYSSLIEKNMDSIFQMFLSDEIFAEKKKGE